MISINPRLILHPGVVEFMLPTWRSGTPSQQRGWRFWVDVCGYLRRVRVFFLVEMYGNVAKCLQACRWNVVFMQLCQCCCIFVFLGTRIKCWSVFCWSQFIVPFLPMRFLLRFSCHRVWLWTTCTPCLELPGWRREGSNSGWLIYNAYRQAIKFHIELANAIT